MPQRSLLPFPHLQDLTMRLLLIGCIIAVLCWVRAVSSTLPLGNPVFIILYGPLCLAFIAALVWYAALYGSPGPGPWRAVNTWIGRTLAILFCSAAIILVIQFFQIVAPEGRCPTRPHWEFLATGVPSARAIIVMSRWEVASGHRSPAVGFFAAHHAERTDEGFLATQVLRTGTMSLQGQKPTVSRLTFRHVRFRSLPSDRHSGNR